MDPLGQPLLTAQPGPVAPVSQTKSMIGMLGRVAGTIEAALPEYEFEWITDNTTFAIGTMTRGDICMLCLCGVLTQCFCMYAKWRVSLQLASDKVNINMSFGAPQQTTLTACLCAGLCGWAITSAEYDRIRKKSMQAIHIMSQQQASVPAVHDISPPSYDPSVPPGEQMLSQPYPDHYQPYTGQQMQPYQPFNQFGQQMQMQPLQPSAPPASEDDNMFL